VTFCDEGAVAAAMAAARQAARRSSSRTACRRSAPRTVVLEHGRIPETGLHDEPLARDGAYARLLSSQSAELVGGSPPEGKGIP